ncbi:MAG: signal peptidase II [Firmicutes bacterium]|nr:signal peptidase II [Bacillota bacterium]
MVYLIAVLVTALDQFIKWMVSTHMQVNTAIPIWPHVLDLYYVQNQGAAFSILLNQRGLLVVVALVVIVAIVYVDRRYARGERQLQVALGLLLGGAVGNLIDRIFRGYVIDYIYVQIIHYPVFNLADSCIVLSILYLIYRAWRRRSESEETPRE